MRSTFSRAVSTIVTAALLLSGCSSKDGSSDKDTESANVGDSVADSAVIGDQADVLGNAQPFDNITAGNYKTMCLLSYEYTGGDYTYGLVNKTNGAVILPAEYTEYKEIKYADGISAMVFSSDSRCTIVDFGNAKVTELEYEYVSELRGHLLLQSTHGGEKLYGVADMQGNIVMPVKEEKRILCYWSDGYYICRGGDGLYDKGGNVVIKKDIADVSRDEGLWLLCCKDADAYKTDIYDSDHQYIQTIDGSVTTLNMPGNNGYFIKQGTDGREYILDSSFEETLASDRPLRFLDDEREYVLLDNKIYDLDGELVYDELISSGDMYVVRKGDETAVLSDDDLTEILIGDYEKVFASDASAIAALDNDGWHFFDDKGQELTETPIPKSLELNSIYGSYALFYKVSYPEENMINYEYAMFYGFDGEKIYDSSELPEEYDTFGSFTDGLLDIYASDGRAAVVDKEGNVIALEGKFYMLATISDGFIIEKYREAQNGDSYGVFNYDGEFLGSCAQYTLLGDGEIFMATPGDIDWKTVHKNSAGEELEDIDIDETVIIVERYDEYGTALAQKGATALLINKDKNVLCEYYFLQELYKVL